MNSKSIKILFVEGDTREVDVVKNMIATFFCSPRIDFKVIPIAVGQNIYMLWNLLKEDDFDSDIIELIRENIPSATKQLEGCTRQNVDEVYLFFDLDKQQDNLPSDKDPNEILQMMLETFDNETGNGKLYISYPMVEALRDFRAGYCQPFYKCVLSEEDIAKDAYKTQTGSEKIFTSKQTNTNTKRGQQLPKHLRYDYVACLTTKRWTLIFTEKTSRR